MLKVLKNLIKTIKTNKNKDIKISYTAYLFKKGKIFCIKKFMEEVNEFAFSAKYLKKKKYNSRSSRFIISFFSPFGI